MISQLSNLCSLNHSIKSELHINRFIDSDNLEEKEEGEKISN